MHPRILQPSFTPILILLIAVFFLIIWMLLPTETVLIMLREGGPVETATIVFYYLAVIFMWLVRPAKFDRRSAFAGSIVLIAMIAREMDLHKAGPSGSMLKLRFWSGDTPLLEIVRASLILGIFFIAVGYLLARYRRGFLNGWRGRTSVSVTMATFFAALVFSKFIDRSIGMMNEIFGYQPRAALRALTLSLEEPCEMTLPIILIIAIIQARLTDLIGYTQER